jgi:predicted dehydrogenase
VVDARVELQAVVRQQYPNVPVFGDWDPVLADSTVDAIVLATPASSHYGLAMKGLDAGKHLLIEKPLATDTADAQAIVNRAKEKNLIVMVGFTVLFIPAIRKLKQLLLDGSQVGELYCGCSTRTGLGIVRPDVSVVWDLASHDVAVFSYLLSEQQSGPQYVTASAAYHFGRKEMCDTAWISVHYASGFVAHMHVSWADARKARAISMVSSHARITMDDMNTEHPIVACFKGLSRGPSEDEFSVVANEGETVYPKVETAEPLKAQCQHFIHCVATGSTPIANVDLGAQNVSILAAAELSIAHQGAPVFFHADGRFSLERQTTIQ